MTTRSEPLEAVADAEAVASPGGSALPTQPAPDRWSVAQRVAFRFAFAYLVLYSFPFPIGMLPGTSWLASQYGNLWDAIVPWVGAHVLGIDHEIPSMGYSTPYTIFRGAAEVLGGALLFFRRTTTLGALVSAAVLGNVALLNFCYDVPVKLYSSHLFLMALFLTLPDVPCSRASRSTRRRWVAMTT